MGNFADAVREGKPLIAPGKDGEQTLELINGAYLSAWTGERICLPIDREWYGSMLEGQDESAGI